MKIHKLLVILGILNTRAITQALLGFVICNSLWGESIRKNSNGSCRKTPHIITNLKHGGSIWLH